MGGQKPLSQPVTGVAERVLAAELANVRKLATRRPESFGHLMNGVVPSLTRLCLITCPDALQQSLRSLMTGDVYTDALVA